MSFWKKVGEVMEGGLLPPDETKPVKKATNRKEVTSLVNTQQDSNTAETKPEHKHQWNSVSTTHAPARRDISQLDSLDKETTERLLFGVTVFLWECIVCHTLREKSVLGSDMNQLDDIMDKALTYGPQYVQRTDGQTFVIAQYKPQTNLVPVR